MAAIGSLLLLGFVLGGLLLPWRDRQRWWKTWLAPCAWGWMAVLALAAMATLAALWQRPRPEHLYALSVAILALIGMCAMAYADRWPASKRIRAATPPRPSCSSFSFRSTSRRATSHHGPSTWTATEGVGRSPLPDPDRAVRGRRQLRRCPRAGGAYLGRDDPCNPVFWSRSSPASGVARSRKPWRRAGSIHPSRRGGAPASLLPGDGREAEAAAWMRAPISAGHPSSPPRRP